MRYILPLLVFEVVVLAYLHYAAVRRNHAELKSYVAEHPEWRRGVWVAGAGYSFHVCGRCVDALLGRY